MSQDNTEKFIELYKKLENITACIYTDNNTQREGMIANLANNRQFKIYKPRIDYCREVRNFLSHNTKIQDDFAIEPSLKMIDFLEDLINELANPPKAFDFAIKRQSTFCANADSYVLPIMKQMRDHIYTHVPILENEVVVGVFSENTVFRFILDNGIAEIEDSTRINEFSEYLPIKKHITENFKFISRSSFLSDVKMEFENAYSKVECLAMLFLTENGKEHEKILGIITPWDVLGKA